MEDLKRVVLKEFGVFIDTPLNCFNDQNMPDQKIYFFEKYALIITDYFSDNDIETFYPKKISEFDKDFKGYRKAKSGNINVMSDFGWLILAEIK